MSIDDAIAKAEEQLASTDSAQDAEQTNEVNSEAPSNDGKQEGSTAQAENSVPKAADESKTPPVWDGDIRKLPETEQAKAVQRYVTRIQQERAEALKRLQELEASQKQTNVVAQPQQQGEQPLVTEEEWNDALLDTTGQKVSVLLRRTAMAEVERLKAEAMPILNQIQQKQSFVEWETRINEFRSVHPEFDELHAAGLIKPYLEKAMASGSQDPLADAFNEGMAVRNYFEAKAMEKAQGRINQKKEASVSGKTPVNTSDFVSATDGDDALEKAAEAAFDKKKVKVKVTR